MSSLSPWINFNGNAAEAFEFYRSVFGGAFAKVVRFKDLAGVGAHVGEEEADKMLMIELPIGGHCSLIGNDVPEVLGRVNEREHRSKIAVNTESKAEADRIFSGLSAGGEVEMPMADSPWGSYAGGFRDKYGIEWIVSFVAK